MVRHPHWAVTVQELEPGRQAEEAESCPHPHLTEEELEEREEAETAHLRFDIAMLARRLAAVTQWLHDDAATRTLPVGYFGASTGGGAALVAPLVLLRAPRSRVLATDDAGRIWRVVRRW